MDQSLRRRRPGGLANLVDGTHFSRKELQVLYRSFKEVPRCPAPPRHTVFVYLRAARAGSFRSTSSRISSATSFPEEVTLDSHCSSDGEGNPSWLPDTALYTTCIFNMFDADSNGQISFDVRAEGGSEEGGGERREVTGCRSLYGASRR